MKCMKRRLLFFFSVLLVCGAPLLAVSKQVLVLYDQGQDSRQPALTDARYLANLLGHFNAKVRLAPMASYKPGAMDRSDVVFYISYDKQFALPQEFKADFYRFNKTFCWLNHHIAQMDQGFLRQSYGFHFSEYREDMGFNKVEYKNKVFPKGDDNLEIVTVDDPARAEIIAYAINTKGVKAPYVIHSRNLWFVADSPFSYATERDRYIVFADLMHDIVGEQHPERHTALVRIEDINPTSDARALKRIVNYLHDKKIPFAVGLSPVYIDPGEKVELHLEDNPRLLALLRELPKMGGSLVLHGYTHQYHGVTTDDYEFWDDIADKPIRGDSVENVSLRINKALKECFNNGIYPLIWETPHYFASPNTYLAIKKQFSCVYERTGTMDHLGTDQFLPYEAANMYGQFVIPENLGYVTLDNPDTTPIIEAANLNLAVRDGYASFFFHPFIELSHLKKIVGTLKEMGYEFKDIKEFMPQVISQDKAVVFGNTQVHLDTHDHFILLREFNSAGKSVSKHIQQTDGKPLKIDISQPKGDYTVVTTQEEPEPGFVTRVWRFAKKDLRHFKLLRYRKSGGKLNEVKQLAFILPASPVKDAREAHDLSSLKFSLSVSGAKYNEISTAELKEKDLRDYDIIVLPHAAAKELTSDSIAHIKEAVLSGSGIMFDGVSRLNDEFNIEVEEDPISVKQIRDYQYPELPLFWPESADVWPVHRAVEKEYRILCVEENSNAPIAVSGKYGNGSFLFLSTYYDPDTVKGYSRFPFLIEAMETVFGYRHLAERKTAEMYFDPGTRQFISIEKLAKLWRKYGINKIYAGGWHFYDKYTYDYGRLIRVCHQNGILVYCWLEPPMVNQKFWNKYPQWREKTALLKDGAVSWRFLMNLADPECRKKAFAETEILLTKYDWDGANVAELYFESILGPAHPEIFTPMNNLVRSEFKNKKGFDPIELFQPDSSNYWKSNPSAWESFAVYRRNLCTQLKIEYLNFLTGIQQKKKDFEIIVTAIDTTLSPDIEYNLGEDMGRLLQLQKKYGFTLQVEDASPFWEGKPERYAQLGNYYRKSVKDFSKLQLDCNVLDNHKKGSGGLPAEKPTGEEMRQIVYNMDQSSCRPVFYSEESIYENDFANITSVLARGTTIAHLAENQWKISAPNMVTIHAGKNDLIPYLNDEPWFACEGENIIIPAGEHVLRFESELRYFDMMSLKPRLTYISADLKWANFLNNAIEFAYDAGPSPCFAVISKRPGKIYIDDKKTSCTIYERDRGFSVKLPSGSHAVRIDMGGGMAFLVESSGVVLFSLIIIFGFFASILFLGLFIIIQIKRRFVKGQLQI